MTHLSSHTAYRRRHIDLHRIASALCQRTRMRTATPRPH
ncbi:MAG: putative leader peptide [Oryzihumus sp.]